MGFLLSTRIREIQEEPDTPLDNRFSTVISAACIAEGVESHMEYKSM